MAVFPSALILTEEPKPATPILPVSVVLNPCCLFEACEGVTV